MAFLNRSVCVSAALLVLAAGTAFPLSLLRPGEPRFKFNKIIAPEKAEAGDEFKIVAFVTPLQNIWDEEQIFIHLLSPDAVVSEYPAQGWQQKGIVLNANTAPRIPSQRWIVGEDVQLGPVSIEIPRGLAPGTYLIQMGLFYIIDPAKKMFVREPYANRDIKDWIVGSIEVTAPRQVRNGNRVEIVLSDFETLGDVKKWESGRRGEMGLVGAGEALDGQYSGCLSFPSDAYLPITMLQSYFESAPPEYTDWEQYDYLEFLFRGEFTPGLYNASHITLQVKDAGGGRYQRPLSEFEMTEVENAAPAEAPAGGTGAPKNPPGGAAPSATPPADDGNNGEEEPVGPRGTVYRMRLPVTDIASRIDVGNVGHLGFFAWGLSERKDWYLTAVIDDIKLVAEKGKKPDWSEPFVVFEGIESPATAPPGSAIKMEASFTIARKFRQDYSVFIHIIREDPPHYEMHVERNPFRSTTTWEVGRLHTEGPIYIPVPQDALPGNYLINVGLFKVREDVSGNARYVNTYRWSDGIYAEEQPTVPVDYIKQPYLNRDSKQQWTVGKISITPGGTARAVTGSAEEAKEMERIIRNTATGILAKPAPQSPQESQKRSRAPAVQRLDQKGAAGQESQGD